MLKCKAFKLYFNIFSTIELIITNFIHFDKSLTICIKKHFLTCRKCFYGRKFYFLKKLTISENASSSLSVKLEAAFVVAAIG